MTPPRAPSLTSRRMAPATGQASPEIVAALERARAFFADRSTRPAVLARGMMAKPLSGDVVLCEHLIRERRRKTRMDGSIHGSLIETTRTLAELLDLGCPHDHAAVVRTSGYVLARQNAPGHFGEGCEPNRHKVGECRHALRGFFSPAPRDDEFEPSRFPTGVVVEHEDDARFAASCYALRVVLRMREDRRAAVREHIESLVGLESLWDMTGDRWDSNLRVFALAALGIAPHPHRAQTEPCAKAFIAMQADDGTWHATNHVHALDALLGFAMPEAIQAMRRAIPPLLARQQSDGSFSPDGDEEVTLIAMRVLTRIA
ncbi:MAG: hypothetical protein V3T56_09995 [Gemmatimonadales bacterium]